MGYLNQFVIPFSGLKVGLHRFEYNIDDKFFEAIEYTEIDAGNVRVDLELERQERMFILNFDFEGELNVVCDRCLDRFDYPLNISKRLIIKFGTERQEISDEILMIPESDHQINISHFLYECIILGLPVKRNHPDHSNGESLCNPLMLKKLNATNDSDIDDPRWDALKKLKFDK